MPGDRHHADAAAGNVHATSAAIQALADALTGRAKHERILLRAAAGAGKSYALKRMVGHSLSVSGCGRVGVTAFTNKQLYPLAQDLGNLLGRERVCLFAAKDRIGEISDSVKSAAVVVCAAKDIPLDAQVVVGTTHKLGGFGQSHLRKHLGPARDGKHLFDVLFIDEAWQLPLHRYAAINSLAPIDVGVGDVGQLPPLDPGENPWRGDRTYNPFRAWPTAFEGDATSWFVDLPAVWRPTEAQLELWRAFYTDWEALDCVAGPGDRSVKLGRLRGHAATIWKQVATGVPTLVEVAGLEEADAADIDPPLLAVVEDWLAALLQGGFAIADTRFDDFGCPECKTEVSSDEPEGRTLIAMLATRNQAVDDAQAVADRLTKRFNLHPGAVVASTVDSWQGQTNAITVAIHPLSGASSLDAFNSAFGRLAVTCTRATHGLLLVSRVGLNDLLAAAPARPGTPLGEPGNRQLPRQTHGRILNTFARAVVDMSPANCSSHLRSG